MELSSELLLSRLLNRIFHRKVLPQKILQKKMLHQLTAFLTAGCFLFFLTHHGLVQAQDSHTQHRHTQNNENNEKPSRLPDVPMDDAQLSGQSQFFIRSFILEGNTQFSDEALAPILSPYENRIITAEELHQLTHALTMHYVAQGFVNSGVIVPNQRAQDGRVRLQFIEGQLVQTDIKGLHYLKENYLSQRLRMPKDRPFNINTLQEQLKLLQKNPRVERVQAEIKPGMQRGEAILAMHVEERLPYTLSLALNNAISANVGGIQGSLAFQSLNFLGMGDTLGLNYIQAQGLKAGEFHYSLPLNTNDTTVSLSYKRSESEVVAQAFRPLNITGDSTYYSISLRHPLTHTLNTDAAIGMRLSERKSRSFLLGEPFSFTPGVNQGRSNATIVSLFHEWVRRNENNVFAWHSTLDAGIADQDQALESNLSSEIPTGKYRALLMQTQWLRRLNVWDSTFMLRGALRRANKPLLAAEQFSLGGVNSVRGYRENLFTRDNGLLLTLGWRIPLMPAKTPHGHNLQLTPFMDYGKGWNNENRMNSREELSSIGLDFQWRMGKHLKLNLSLAHALNDNTQEVAEYDLQDDGIAFSLIWQAF